MGGPLFWVWNSRRSSYALRPGPRRPRPTFPPFRHLKWSPQGITQHNLETTERHAFSTALRRLAERHELLPDRVVVKQKVDVSHQLLTFGGVGGVGLGEYIGDPVAVKTTRVATRDNLQKIRKVSIGVGHPGNGLNHSVSAVLPASRPLEHAITSERLGTRRSSGGRGERAVRRCVRVDEAREHYGLHSK